VLLEISRATALPSAAFPLQLFAAIRRPMILKIRYAQRRMLPLIALLAAIHVAPETAALEYKQPQLAADSKIVVMAFGSGKAIYFASSTDQGRTFSKPEKVAEAESLALGRHRGPRIAITPQAIVISAVVGHTPGLPGGAEGDLTAWRSTDHGKTWSKGVVINDVPAATREGLHTMVAGHGLMFAAWLDLREKGTRLYGSVSKDGGATWSKNMLVYESPSGTICQCCHPSALIDAKGNIFVMWRNVLNGSRDMYVVRSTDGGRTFTAEEKQGKGTWPLEACPMDGGGLVVAPSGSLISVWRRADTVYMTPEGGNEVKLEEGKDAAIAMGSSGVYTIWTHGSSIHAKIPGKPGIETLDSEGGYPNLVATPQGQVIAAWENKGKITVQPLP
jgi:photosystem II stability/assembly factor-like uncharacterized protein